jgi:hypothetical protein
VISDQSPVRRSGPSVTQVAATLISIRLVAARRPNPNSPMSPKITRRAPVVVAVGNSVPVFPNPDQVRGR